MRCIALFGLATLLASSATEARVTRIEITRTEPFAAGQTFGDVGAYEKVVGRFHGELDPAHALNAGIVDIDNAPRNAAGHVEYSADFYVLKPVDMAKGNGALLYDVNNRGSKRALIQFNSAPASNDPTSPQDAGNGFLMRQGYTVVFSGWLPGLPAEGGLLRLQVPVAHGKTSPIEQTVWDEFLFNDKATMQAKLSFPVDKARQAEAKLFVRGRNAEEPATVAAADWEFVDDRTVRLLPAGTPFQIGAIYQLVYRAKDP